MHALIPHTTDNDVDDLLSWSPRDSNATAWTVGSWLLIALVIALALAAAFL